MKNMDSIKTFIISLATGIVAYFSPIDNEIQILVILFALNFIAGVSAGLIAENDEFRFKKAFRCIAELTCVVVFISSMFSIGERKGNVEATLQCVSFVTYVCIWFYSQNILRNLRSLFKEGAMYKVVDFLYYVISVEFVKKIPMLSSYLKTEKQEEKKEVKK